jgi:hypothetical protein
VGSPPPRPWVTASSNPAACVTAAAPSAPAAGPDRTVVIGVRAIRSAEVTPPFDFITKNGVPAPARSASRSARRAT